MLRNKLVYNIVSLLRPWHIGRDTSEIIHQGIFLDVTQKMGITTSFYPVGAAANYTFLYIIMRIILDGRIKNVLEIGAGQSTLLLDALRKTREFNAFTIETNEEWHSIISAQVGHDVLLKPLSPVTLFGHKTLAYHHKTDDKYDFLIIDGPHGTPRRSRWAALDIIDRMMAEEFIIVFDDCERKGEQDTIRKAISLIENKRQISTSIKIGLKCQFIITTPGFNFVHYF